MMKSVSTEKKTDRLLLTTILLYRWHQFDYHLISVCDDLYITGETGAGKSTLLDAVQVVLIADLKRIHFNQAASDERSRIASQARTVETYIRWKQGESFRRTGDVISYIVLEFLNEQTQERCTIGVCFEAREARPLSRLHFLLDEPLDQELFLPNGQGRAIKDLRRLLRERVHGAAFESGQIDAYQEELRHRLGGIHHLFFDIFAHALSFTPIRDIRAFVKHMFLAEEPLEIDHLQGMQSSLKELSLTIFHLEHQVMILERIVTSQQQLWKETEILNIQRVVSAQLQMAATRQDEENVVAQILHIGERLEKARELFLESDHEQELVQQRYLICQNDYVNHGSLLKQERLHSERNALQRDVDVIQRRALEFRTLLQQLTTLLGEGVQQLQAHISMDNDEHTLPPLIEVIEIRKLLDQLGIASCLSHAQLRMALEQCDQVVKPLLSFVEHERQTRCFQETERNKFENELRSNLEIMDRNQGVLYPPNIEHARQRLHQKLGVLPTPICECIDILDERWQKSIEALLGDARFTLLVPAEMFPSAQCVLQDLWEQEHLSGIGLLDIGRILPSVPEERFPHLGALLQAFDDVVRWYVYQFTEGVVCCDRIEDLFSYHAAVTPDGWYYARATLRMLAPSHEYMTMVVGQQAKKMQYARLNEQLVEVTRHGSLVTSRRESLDGLVNLYHRIHDSIVSLIAKLEEQLPLDVGGLLQALVENERQLEELDLSDISVLEEKITRLKEQKNQLQRQCEKKREDMIQCERDESALLVRNQEVMARLSVAQRHVQQVEDELPQSVASAQAICAQFAGEQYHTEWQNAQHLIEALREQVYKLYTETSVCMKLYNDRYACDGNPDAPETELRYAQLYHHLQEMELPLQRTQLMKIRRSAEDALQQHILHRLSEQFTQAELMFQRLNATLASIQFHGQRYRLKIHAREELQTYHAMIMESKVLGYEPLIESVFYQEHQTECETFFATLLNEPKTFQEREKQALLLDYRNYLEYEVEIVDVKQKTVTRLSQTLHERSGGEMQTPFYVIIAAAFAHLYGVGAYSGRPTLCLAVFDEAFSKMDEQYLDATLDVFHSFGLQIIIATPPDRCPYLAHRLKTSIALVQEHDGVHIESARRYLNDLS